MWKTTVALASTLTWGLRTGRRRLRSTQPWTLAQRFCFGGGGKGEVRWRAKAAHGLWMLVYVERKVSDFAAMQAAAFSKEPLRERFDKAAAVVWIGPNATSGTYRYERSSPRWLFVVFSNFDVECSREYLGHCNGDIAVDFRLRLTDGASELPRDEAGLLAVYAALVVASTGLGIMAFAMRRLLAAQDKLHPTPRLLSWSVAAAGTAACLGLAHYTSSSLVGGGGAPRVLRAARLVFLTADAAVLLVVLLCARGWNVVRRKLHCVDRTSCAVFAVTYLCLVVVAFGWHIVSYDPAAVVYLYATGPGYLLVACRLAAGASALWACAQTHARYGAKQGFYAALGFVTTQWTVAVPFAVFVSSLVDDYDRMQVADGLERCLGLATQAALVFLFLPINPNFPFQFQVAKQQALRLVYGHRVEPQPDIARASVSGGRGRDVDGRGRYVVKDGFEALHVRRLRRVQVALESRLDSLNRLSTELQSSLRLCRLTNDICPRIPRTPVAPMPRVRRIHLPAPPLLASGRHLTSPEDESKRAIATVRSIPRLDDRAHFRPPRLAAPLAPCVGGQLDEGCGDEGDGRDSTFLQPPT